MRIGAGRGWITKIAPPKIASYGLLCLLLGLAACEEDKTQAQTATPPTVTVTEAVAQTVPVVREFVGNTAAVKLVDVRAKVAGYLEQRPFTEGADVKTGDVLFVIDQRPFQAALEQSQANHAQDQANLKFAKEQVARYKPLLKNNNVSKQKYENLQSQELADAAAVKASAAAVKNAQLNLDYTTITAPIDGRIGHTLVNVGNLVSAEDTLLTTIVQLDPIYVYFSPSEADYQEIVSYQSKGSQTYNLILAGDRLYPQEGKLDFVDNQVDPQTDTIKMRAVFPNPDKTERPGQYAKVQVTLGQQENAILVPAPALGEDEAGHYLYVVGADNKVEQRRITLGATVKDQIIVASGLKSGEKVITKGVQKVHAGLVVDPQLAAKTSTTETTATQ